MDGNVEIFSVMSNETLNIHRSKIKKGYDYGSNR